MSLVPCMLLAVQSQDMFRVQKGYQPVIRVYCYGSSFYSMYVLVYAWVSQCVCTCTVYSLFQPNMNTGIQSFPAINEYRDTVFPAVHEYRKTGIQSFPAVHERNTVCGPGVAWHNVVACTPGASRGGPRETRCQQNHITNCPSAFARYFSCLQNSWLRGRILPGSSPGV